MGINRNGSVGRVVDIDLRIAGWRLKASRVTVLCSLLRYFIRCLILVQPRKTGNHSDVTEKLLRSKSRRPLNNSFIKGLHHE